MDKYLSNKLRVISLISVAMVVFIHSYNTKFMVNNTSFYIDYSSFMQNFISQGITRVAAPFFFATSGYLFFLKFKGTISEFVTKYRKRVKTLLLPYLLWSVWGLVLHSILQLVLRTKDFSSNDIIESYSLVKILRTVFFSPIPYHLWFIRDLMMLVIISPLIYWSTRYLKAIPVIILFIIWLDFFKFSILIFTKESVLFFYMGAYFSINRSKPIKKMNKKYYWAFTFIWFLIILIKTTLIHQGTEQSALLVLLHKTCIIIGLLSIWSIYDILMTEKTTPNKAIIKLSYFSFFLYAFHEPILSFMKAGFFHTVGVSEIKSVLIYFLAPIVLIIISTFLASFIKRYIPKFYELIADGRLHSDFFHSSRNNFQYTVNLI